MAHSRSIALFRKVMGPHYDLSALWDRHTELEFGVRSAEQTMGTMVAEPYVNHIPTMTGGVGYRDLLRFTPTTSFPKTPQDTKLIPISRTIGADRVVDEMLFSFTHDIEIDWMLPGVAPTGKFVEVPLIAIVRFRGDKLYNEHIYTGIRPRCWCRLDCSIRRCCRLPASRLRRKLVDETLPSNTLMTRWAESAPASRIVMPSINRRPPRAPFSYGGVVSWVHRQVLSRRTLLQAGRRGGLAAFLRPVPVFWVRRRGPTPRR